MRKNIFYNTVNFQPVTFRILFFRGIQTLQMRLSRKACFWWTQLLRPFCRAADCYLNTMKVLNEFRVTLQFSLICGDHLPDYTLTGILNPEFSFCSPGRWFLVVYSLLLVASGPKCVKGNEIKRSWLRLSPSLCFGVFIWFLLSGVKRTAKKPSTRVHQPS